LKAVISKAIKGQKTWTEYGREDLRHLSEEFRLKEEELVEASESIEMAMKVLQDKLIDKDGTGTIMSPIGDITIHHSTLEHIVEKRKDARERYINFAIKTIEEPYEIYRVEYDDGSIRLAFIGAFQGKRQMLVIAKGMENEGNWLWNFMHCDAKSLNKHRHGDILYQRM
jgi:hypothetical protein